jgi:hypothetical protein
MLAGVVLIGRSTSLAEPTTRVIPAREGPADPP